MSRFVRLGLVAIASSVALVAVPGSGIAAGQGSYLTTLEVPEGEIATCVVTLLVGGQEAALIILADGEGRVVARRVWRGGAREVVELDVDVTSGLRKLQAIGLTEAAIYARTESLTSGGLGRSAGAAATSVAFDRFRMIEYGSRNQASATTVLEAPAEVSPGAERLVLAARCVPNPFNPKTSILATIPSEGHVRIDVFDVRGARVRVLQDGIVGAGRHRFEWDGRDNAGIAVGSGVYLYRVATESGEVSGKAALLK